MPITTKPNTFTANEIIDANQMNQNFDSIYGVVNGGLDASNIAVNGINDFGKLANEVVIPSKSKGLMYSSDLFSQSWVVAGGLATFSGSPVNQIQVNTVSANILQVDGTYRHVSVTATSYTTSALNSTYFLDLQPDGTMSWGTTHSTQAGYLPLASVTTNGSGNVLAITDVRVLSAGIAWINLSKVSSSLADLATRNASDLTGTLGVANGGTGANTLSGLVKGNGTGAFTAVTAPTGQLVGTTDVQTLINKIIDAGQLTGTVLVARLPTGIPAPNIGNGDVDNTKLSFLNSVTSNVQTQLNAKGVGSVTSVTSANSDLTVATTTSTPTLTLNSANSGANKILKLDSSGNASADLLIDGTTNKAYTAAEKTKLAGVAAGATANLGTVTSITSPNSDIAIGGTSAIPTVTANTGTGANQIVKRDANKNVVAGTLGGGNGGVLIGGADPLQPDGILYGTDGNPSWATMQTSRRGANTELTIQPNSYNGIVNTSGTAVTWVSGDLFDSAWIGANIYINNVLYHVQSVNSTTSITLTATAGTQSNKLYQKVSTASKGFVNTNGTAVTWVSGELFAYWWTSIVINNVTYTVSSVATNGLSLTLSATAGVQNNVNYIVDQPTSYDCAAIGLNKMSGTNEERIVIVAKAIGEYHIATIATGSGQHYPLYLDTGGHSSLKIDTDGTLEILVQSNGSAQMSLNGNKQYYLISKNTGELSIYHGNGLGDILVVDGAAGRVNFKYPPVFPSYAKASLPSAVAAGSQIYVTDDVGGAVPAFSDGTNWRRVTDRAVIA